jgi:hypothetical protein
MKKYVLKQGEGYEIDAKHGSWSGKLDYVAEQFLFGENWETFYTILGDLEHGRIIRIRTPSRRIIEVKNRKIISDGELIDKHIWPYEPVRNPKVQEWMNEIEKIMKLKGFENSGIFKEYFK